METKVIPVIFTIAELWMLADFIRHEIPDHEKWAYPPASKDLNTEIALAIATCTDNNLDEYTLLLSEGDVLVIDYNIRAAHKTPEGAKGKDILLKLYHARSKLSYDYSIGDNEDSDDYKSAVRKKEKEDAAVCASTNNNSDDDSDTDTVPVS